MNAACHFFRNPNTSIVSRWWSIVPGNSESTVDFHPPRGLYIYLRQDSIKIKPSPNLGSFMDHMGSSSGVPSIDSKNDSLRYITLRVEKNSVWMTFPERPLF